MTTLLATEDFGVSWLTEPPRETKPEVRAAAAAIFDDFFAIEADKRDLVSPYLEGSGEPLRRLGELGFQIMAVQMAGARRTDT